MIDACGSAQLERRCAAEESAVSGLSWREGVRSASGREWVTGYAMLAVIAATAERGRWLERRACVCHETQIVR